MKYSILLAFFTFIMFYSCSVWGEEEAAVSTVQVYADDAIYRYEDQGYLQRREEMEQMLVTPETPPFLYKVGVNGFMRGEGVGNFSLTDFSFAPGRSEGRFLYRVKSSVA